MSKRAKRPKTSITGTKEWAAKTVNCVSGCSHGCLYCYAAWNACVRHKRMPRAQWTTETIRDHDVRKKRSYVPGRVMFPSTHDITPTTVDACENVLLKLLAAGNEVLVVSKPHLACVERLLQSLAPYQDKVQFRFTIGVMDEDLRAFWEPGAPAFSERLECLRRAFEAGYATSVSAEPLLEPWNVQGLVAAVHPFVTDSIWIGKLNVAHARTRWAISTDNPRLVRLQEWQTDEKVHAIYEMFRNDPLLKWKESFKEVIGLDLATQAGLDI